MNTNAGGSFDLFAPLRRRADRSERERGAVAILVTLLMVPMLGLLGLVLDGGRIFSEHRAAQNAADAAAWAAAYDIAMGGNSSAVTATALYYAARNGYSSNSMTQVVVHTPPVNGLYAGNSSYVQVKINRTFPTFLVGLFTKTPFLVASSATGGLTSGSAGYAIWALNPTACGSLTFNGNGDLHLMKGASAQINSTCSANAGVKNGSGNFTAEGGGRIRVVGGWRQVGSGQVTPPVLTRQPALRDPLADLMPPTTAGLTVRNGTPNNPATYTYAGSTNITLWPGIYYGGIRITGSGNVTMMPGLYYIAGGGLTLSGSGDLTANNILVYNTNDPARPTGAGAYGGITFNGTGNVSITPSTLPGYAGLSFFQDRANSLQATFNGNGNVLGGTMYFKSAAFRFNGNGDIESSWQIIADTINFNGTGDLVDDFNTDLLYQSNTAALVE